MDNQLWDRVQMFIDAGRADMVVHLLVDEMRNNLSPLQIQQLGDLEKSLTEIFSGDNKTSVSAKEFIGGFIDLVKRGAIVGVDKSS